MALVIVCQNCPCENLIEIVLLSVYYTIPFGFSLFWQFIGITFHFLNFSVLLSIIDEGSLTAMCTWSILLIESDVKWCTHHSTMLFLYLYHTKADLSTKIAKQTSQSP